MCRRWQPFFAILDFHSVWMINYLMLKYCDTDTVSVTEPPLRSLIQQWNANPPMYVMLSQWQTQLQILSQENNVITTNWDFLPDNPPLHRRGEILLQLIAHCDILPSSLMSHYLNGSVTHKEEANILCSAVLSTCGERENPSWQMHMNRTAQEQGNGIWAFARRSDGDSVTWSFNTKKNNEILSHVPFTCWHHFHLGLLCDKEYNLRGLTFKFRSQLTDIDADFIADCYSILDTICNTGNNTIMQ